MIDLGKKYYKNKKNGQGDGRKSGAALAVRLILMTAIASVIGLGGFYGYRFYEESRNDGFLLGTTVQGDSVYGMTVDEVVEELAQQYDDSEITLTENGETDLQGSLADYGYSLDEEFIRTLLQEELDSQKSDKANVFKSILGLYSYGVQIEPDFNESKFDEMVSIENLALDRYPSENAKVVYSEETGSCEIQPEVQGNEIDEDVLRAYVQEEINEILRDVEENGFEADGTQEITESTDTGSSAEQASIDSTGAERDNEIAAEGETISTGAAAEEADVSAITGSGLQRSIEFPWSLCEAPEILSTDPKLQEEMEALNEYAGAQVTYDFGDKTEVLSFDEIAEMMDFAGSKAVLDDEKVAEYVAKLADKYDTRYRERTFETTAAGTITISAGDCEYGYTIDQESEIEQLTQDIQSAQAVEREPVYYTKNSYGNPYYLRRSGTDDLDGTYVEVDLTSQYMWFYQDGDLVVESDVVTGDVTNGHGTKTGIFPLAYKESPSVLTGGNGNGAYETEVQYWMPFYEGQGLHDAWWRSYFGGSIYRGNGSHGCVNLPSSVAETVYNNIEVGTAIVIYYE